jgi:hypothetical protein
MIVYEAIRSLLLPEVFNRVRPQDIAHEAMCWWFSKAVNLSVRGRINFEPVGAGKYITPTARMSSSVLNSGERPPWMQRNCLFMIAASGSAQKDSMQASYTRSEYLCLPIISARLA